MRLIYSRVDASLGESENGFQKSLSESAVSRIIDAACRASSLLLAICVAGLLSACGAPAPKPTVIAATIDGAADLNPDSRGRASPVVVRLFELKTLAVFDSADFFSLWDRESQTLAADLVAREEFQLRPGERRSVERTLQADTKHVAVMAAFRDLERAQWRDTLAVTPNRKHEITIRLGARTIAIAGK